MSRVAALAAALFLSTCSGGTPAFAFDCRPTQEAMAYAASNKLRPMVLRGAAMTPFVEAAGSIAPTTVNFVAVIRDGEGALAFFGNFSLVCGPLHLTKENLNAMLRPS